MADKVKGGRSRINGLTMSRAEKSLVDRARQLGLRKSSRAEYIREAAVEKAHREVAAAADAAPARAANG